MKSDNLLWHFHLLNFSRPILYFRYHLSLISVSSFQLPWSSIEVIEPWFESRVKMSWWSHICTCISRVILCSKIGVGYHLHLVFATTISWLSIATFSKLVAVTKMSRSVSVFLITFSFPSRPSVRLTCCRRPSSWMWRATPIRRTSNA